MIHESLRAWMWNKNCVIENRPPLAAPCLYTYGEAEGWDMVVRAGTGKETRYFAGVSLWSPDEESRCRVEVLTPEEFAHRHSLVYVPGVVVSSTTPLVVRKRSPVLVTAWIQHEMFWPIGGWGQIVGEVHDLRQEGNQPARATVWITDGPFAGCAVIVNVARLVRLSK